MSSRRKLPILLAAAASLLLGINCPASRGAVPENIDNQIAVMENRYFFHQYANDPIEKRLERIELLIFGATQEGTSEQRFARLKQSIAERDKASALKSRPAAPAAPGTATKPAAPSPSGSSQYPILNTLEWRALKKTFPGESLDARLGRLESKLFGQPSPAMAYADRVERLNRTLGVGAAVPTAPPVRIGPMPKAMPRSQQFGWNAPMNPGEEMMPGFGGGMGMGGAFDMSGRFAEIFRQMDQQMEQMMKMPPGVYQFDYQDDGVRPPSTKRRGTPIPIPQQREEQDYKPKVPPYYDPNSI
jgi:hypothetical protein